MSIQNLPGILDTISVEVTYLAKAFCSPMAGDDAAKAFVVKLEDIPWDQFAFDHAEILKDYLQYRDKNFNDHLLR